MNEFFANVDMAAAILTALPFLILPLEIWRLNRANRLDRRTWLEIATNFSPLVPTILAASATLAYIAWLYGTAASLAPWKFPVNGWTLAAAIVLVDFIYYWDHRFGHRVRIAWALYHSVHHSSPLFNQTTAVRVSFVDGFIVPWFYLPLVIAGFHPVLVLSALGIVLAYQQWLHTETIGRLGWIDAIFNSPSNHRVHHAIQPEYIDKNYGGILIVWDRLFGTYAEETAEPVYGLTEQIDSVNPITVHVAEAMQFAKGVMRLKTWRKRLTYAFQGPEGKVQE